MTKRMRSFYLLLMSVSVLTFLGCSQGETVSFANVKEINASEPYAAWIPFLPSKSKNIELWFDVETGLARASFILDERRPLAIVGMSPIKNSNFNAAVAEYPALKSAPKLSILYSCISADIALVGKSDVHREVRFIGDDGKRVFYWNSFSSNVIASNCGMKTEQ